MQETDNNLCPSCFGQHRVQIQLLKNTLKNEGKKMSLSHDTESSFVSFTNRIQQVDFFVIVSSLFLLADIIEYQVQNYFATITSPARLVTVI